MNKNSRQTTLSLKKSDKNLEGGSALDNFVEHTNILAHKHNRTLTD